jgi:hypothetical protein
MALHDRLELSFGKFVLASAVIIGALTLTTPARADSDVRVIIGLPAAIGLVFGITNDYYRDRRYRVYDYPDRYDRRRFAYRHGYRDSYRHRHDRRRHNRHGPTYEADRYHP